MDGGRVNKNSLQREVAACFGERAAQGEGLTAKVPDAFFLQGKKSPVKFDLFAGAFVCVHQGADEMVIGLECWPKKEQGAGTIKEQEAEDNTDLAGRRSFDL